MNNQCTWKYNKNWYIYETACGQIFQFDEINIPENYKYCSYCGKQIKEIKNV